MAKNPMLPPLIEDLAAAGVDVKLTVYQDKTSHLPVAVQENLDGLFAFALDGFYKNGQVHMVLNDDDKSYTVYGLFSKLSGDVRSIDDLMHINYQEWTRWRASTKWDALTPVWEAIMASYNERIRQDDDIANSFILDLIPYHDEEETGTCVGHTDEPAWVLR